MSPTNTRVEIAFNRFLDPIFIAYIQAQEKWKNWQPLSIEETEKNIIEYQNKWNDDSLSILKALKDITQLGFVNQLIRVHVVRGNPRPFSNPIVMKSTYPACEFVDRLTHELIHALLSENNAELRFLNKLTDRRDDSTRIHILVHAIHKKIYVEYLKSPERLAANIARSEQHGTGDYVMSWKIVENLGYEKIIEEFKNSQTV